jgi:lactam utilization protein B
MPPISSTVKINVDLGEGYGNFKAGPDDELIPLIDYANIACGGHAGDPMIMHQTVKACKAHNIAMGAHPGLPDIQGFGRRYIRYDPEELTAIVRYQIGALKGFLDAEGVELHHVKPHGTLYGMLKFVVQFMLLYRRARLCLVLLVRFTSRWRRSLACPFLPKRMATSSTTKMARL